MPQMSMPLHPQVLQGIEGGSRVPGVVGPAQPALPPGVARQAPSPGLLAGFQFGGAPGMQPSTGNPFQGNQNPGAFGTPAPFNPLLAQTLLGMRGGLPGFGGGMPGGMRGMMPRGPLGSFGLTPERQRPRGANPYR